MPTGSPFLTFEVANMSKDPTIYFERYTSVLLNLPQFPMTGCRPGLCPGFFPPADLVAQRCWPQGHHSTDRRSQSSGCSPTTTMGVTRVTEQPVTNMSWWKWQFFITRFIDDRQICVIKRQCHRSTYVSFHLKQNRGKMEAETKIGSLI